MKRGFWLILLLIALIGLGTVFFVSGRSEEEGAEARIPLDESSVQFVRPTVIGMLDGVRQWELETERMREQGDLVYMEQIERGLLYREGEEYVTFTADEGIWNRHQDELELLGNVEVFRDGERLLESERLVWQGRSEVLASPGPVQIAIDGNKIRADEMIGNVKQDELVFLGNVHLTGERISLSVPNKLIYQVEDGSMQGFGTGQFQFSIERSDGSEADGPREGSPDA